MEPREIIAEAIKWQVAYRAVDDPLALAEADAILAAIKVKGFMIVPGPKPLSPTDQAMIESLERIVKNWKIADGSSVGD